MPLFSYRAYTDAGDLSTGEIEATSERAAHELINQQGLIPLAVTHRASEKTENWWEIELTSPGRVPMADLARFTRECATLVEAELPIDQVLRILVDQAPSAKLRQPCKSILASVLNGASLSDAMREFPKAFPAFYTGIVQAGEATGHLKHVFNELAGYLEQRVQTASKIKSALIYPAVLGLVAIIAVGIIISVLVPNLVPLFEDTGAELPGSLALIVGLRSAFLEYWPLAGLGLAAVLIGIRLLLASHAFRLWRDRMIMKLPLFGPLAQKRESARFGRMLGTLLKAGVTLLPALQIARTATTNTAVSAMLEEAADDLRKGDSLHGPFARSALFPSLVTQLITVGEETGRLDHMLLHMAQIFEQQAEAQIQRMMTLLTPALTLLIGLGVGSLIIAVMNAILSVNELAF